MNDFRAEPPELVAALEAAAARVIRSGHYVLGPEVIRFEQAWAGRCATNHAVGVGNGMDAIEIGLRAIGIGAGDEVITTPMTAFATVLAILRSGATPVLADIDPDTALLSMDSVARVLTQRTRAVLLVHLYGRAADLGAWERFCGAHGIDLLEDCAQAHLAVSAGRPVGTVGRFGAFSFYPTKNLGAIGDAGMLVTSDPALAAAAASLRNYGQSDRYHHPRIGLNSRLDELQAALLSARLPWLGSQTARRREIAAAYRAGIDHPMVTLPPEPAEAASHVHHLFVVTSPAREALKLHLEAEGVQTHAHYPVPVHHQPPIFGIRHDPLGLSKAEAHSERCLSLPCHPGLSHGQVTSVIEAVNRFASCVRVLPA